VPIVMKSGSFNLPEPSWPLQACNGIALAFLHLFIKIHTQLHVSAVFKTCAIV